MANWDDIKKHLKSARTATINSGASLIGHTKFADDFHRNMEGDGKRITVNNVGSEAIAMVRNITSNMKFPSHLKLAYAGLKRTANGFDNKELNNGVVTVNAEFKTLTGAHVNLDIPIEIRNGHLLDPAVFFHDGRMKVFAQSAINDLSHDLSTFMAERGRGMFDPPQDYEAENYTHESHRPGVYTIAAKNPMTSPKKPAKQLNTKPPKMVGPKAPPDFKRLCAKCFHAPCVCVGKRKKKAEETNKTAYQYMLPGGAHVDPHANAFKDDYLDPAERDFKDYIQPGMRIKTTQKLMAPDRGGVRNLIASGTEGTVLRDMAGDGKQLYCLLDTGLKTIIQQRFLDKIKQHKTSAVQDPITQIQSEIKSMKESGLAPIDIDMAIQKRYPEYADEALKKNSSLVQWYDLVNKIGAIHEFIDNPKVISPETNELLQQLIELAQKLKGRSDLPPKVRNEVMQALDISALPGVSKPKMNVQGPTPMPVQE